jgi:hypothetical protein
MIVTESLPLPFASGQVRPFHVRNGVWQPAGTPEHNAVLYGAATIMGQLLRGQPDGRSWRLGAVYLEYENNGGVAVSAPAFDRSGGRDYYDGLGLSATRDYLRVPLTAQTFESSDDDLYPGGNLLTVFAQTAGVEGVNGKTFSHTVQSRVFGGALVATPEFSDPTQDVVFSRFYYDVASNQLVKLAGSQIGLTWELTLQ